MTRAWQWNHRVDRLLSMDRHELLDRLRQRLTARADVLRYRGASGFASSPHLGPGGPAGRFFFAPTDVPALCAELKQGLTLQENEIFLQAENLDNQHFL